MPEVALDTVSGYLAVPSGSQGPWPGVVVIHESWGLNGDIRAHADRLARLDYKPGSAEDSWRRIFAFLGEHLRSAPAASS
jgi:hypothetical protein